MPTMTVIWIELTSLLEENLTKTHIEKMDRYDELAVDLREGKYHGVRWTVVPLCVEVGARGVINDNPGTGCENVSASVNVQSDG